ncbi:MAG: hypothetical protein ACRCYU_09525, partial [Nocardioides sp.]
MSWKESNDMNDRGLSIFDDEPEGAAATAVTTPAERPAAGSKTATVASATPAKTSAPAAKTTPATNRPAANATAGKAAPATNPLAGATKAASSPASSGRPPMPSISAPNFTQVRRGGYDKYEVDTKFKQLSGEKSGLSSSLAASQEQVMALEEQMGALRKQLAENQTPSYAGLGGRASAMLRLA